MIYNQSILSFSENLASKNPSPGGGVVAGLNALTACSLLEMVSGILKDKDEDRLYDEILIDLNKYHAIFLENMEIDSKAFLKVLEAFKLPKVTEKDKYLRSEKIQEGYIYAASIPRDLMLNTAKLLTFSEALIKKCNKMLISDIYVANNQILAAINNSKVNVLINLTYIKDINIKEQILKEINECESKVTSKIQNLNRQVLEIIGE